MPAKRLDLAELAELFHQEHERTYGHRSQKDAVHLVNARLTARLRSRPRASVSSRAPDAARRPADRLRPEKGAASIAVIGRSDLDGTARRGPFVIEEYDCTCVVARARMRGSTRPQYRHHLEAA